MAETGVTPMCEGCLTPEGCPEHRLFTCASCGKLTSWSDASDDERSDDCSECWSKWLAGQVSAGSSFGVAASETELLEAIAHSPPRTFCGKLVLQDSGGGAGALPSPDTLGQVPRSWPPNTGCDPTVPIVAFGDPPPLAPPPDLKVMGVVAFSAERVRRVVNGAVFAALASNGVPEISVDASYQIADRISTWAADQFARALYSEAVLHKERDLTPDESTLLTAALVDQRLESP